MSPQFTRNYTVNMWYYKRDPNEKHSWISSSKMPDFCHVGHHSAIQAASKLLKPTEFHSPVNEFKARALRHGLKFEPQANGFLRRQSFFKKEFEPYNQSVDGRITFASSFTEVTSGYSFQLSATPDMIVNYQSDTQIPVEIKCPSGLYESGRDLSHDSMQLNHWIQLQTQCLVLNAPFGLLWIYIPDREDSVEQGICYRITHTPEVREFLLTKAWQTYKKMEGGVVEDLSGTFRARNGEKKEASAFISQLASKTTQICGSAPLQIQNVNITQPDGGKGDDVFPGIPEPSSSLLKSK